MVWTGVMAWRDVVSWRYWSGSQREWGQMETGGGFRVGGSDGKW